jgi:hypothetical protein
MVSSEAAIVAYPQVPADFTALGMVLAHRLFPGLLLFVLVFSLASPFSDEVVYLVGIQ